jgi:N-acetylmuramoyl-L-alanine amidase
MLKKAGAEVKLLIDSSMILVNGAPLDIEQPVLFHNDMVVIPSKFKERVIDRFYQPIPVQAVPSQMRPYAIKRVVVDAGHGGRDPGAIGRTGLREKDVNLDIARRLNNLLRAQGIDVVMTRSTDTFITLERRVEIGNRANADFFISVHSNAARSKRLSGFEVYYITEKVNDANRAFAAARNADLGIDSDSFYQSSLNLKATLWDMLYSRYRVDSFVLAQNICEAVSRNLEVKVLGVKGAPFYVLKGAHIPAVLVEVGFLSNATEEKHLRNGFYRQQIAEAICEGILNYGRKYQLVGRE